MTDDEQFDYFWDLYGKKVARKVALSAWKHLTLEQRRSACEGLKDRVANDRQWLNGFQPHPATYLNGQRWNDKWERHIPRSQRPDNVRDTTSEKLDPEREQQGLAKLREMCGPDNDPTPLDLDLTSSEAIENDAMQKMAKLLPNIRTDYKPQDEEALQARKRELEKQAEQLMDNK